MATGGSRKVVLAALISNAVIAAASLTAGLDTGSAAMLSAAVHSLIGASCQALLLYGLGRTGHPAGDPRGSIGELHFWGFVAAVLLFALGAGVAIHEGVDRLVHPRPIVRPEVNLIVLGLALALAAVSAWVAIAELDRLRGSTPRVAALRAARDPSIFIVLLEGLATLAGLLIALAGIGAAHPGGWPQGDGMASVVIGLLLGLVAALFAVELKGLLIGAGRGESQPGATAHGSRGESPRGEVAASGDARREPTPAPPPAPPSVPAVPEPKPQLVARPPHAKKGRGKRRR